MNAAISTQRTVPAWLRPRRTPRPGPGVGVASTLLYHATPGGAAQAPTAPAGSTLTIAFPPSSTSASVQQTTAQGTQGAPVMGTDLLDPTVPTITVTLDGNPGSITATWTPGALVSGSGWSAPPSSATFIVTLAGAPAGLTFPPLTNIPRGTLPSPGTSTPTPSPGSTTSPIPSPIQPNSPAQSPTTPPPAASAGGSAASAASTSSSTGTVIAVGVGVVAAGALAWWALSKNKKK